MWIVTCVLEKNKTLYVPVKPAQLLTFFLCSSCWWSCFLTMLSTSSYNCLARACARSCLKVGSVVLGVLPPVLEEDEDTCLLKARSPVLREKRQHREGFALALIAKSRDDNDNMIYPFSSTGHHQSRFSDRFCLLLCLGVAYGPLLRTLLLGLSKPIVVSLIAFVAFGNSILRTQKMMNMSFVWPWTLLRAKPTVFSVQYVQYYKYMYYFRMIKVFEKVCIFCFRSEHSTSSWGQTARNIGRKPDTTTIINLWNQRRQSQQSQSVQSSPSCCLSISSGLSD